MIKQLFQASPTVASAALIVGTFSMLSRVAGFARDRILIGLFPADTLDVYYQSFRLPDLLFQLLVVGAISASFIPVFTRAWKEDEKERAWKYTNNILHVVLLLFGILSLIAILFAPLLSPIILAPGFTPEKQTAVAQMTRIIFLGQFFFAFSMVFGSVLQGAKRFLIPSFAPIIYNAGIIIGALFIVPLLGVMGLAWGVVLGSFLHALVQAVGAFSLGYKYRPYIKFNDPDLLQTAWQTFPRIMGLAVNQVNFLMMSAIATHLVSGSIRNLNLAYNLNFFPIGIIAISYAVAAYPTFCERVAHRDIPGLRASFSLTTRQVLFFMIPATVLFLLLRAQIVRVIFGSQGLDWSSTIEVANTVAIFALSFFAQATIYIAVRAYYAMEDTVSPFLIGLASAIVNLALAIPLAATYGIFGLAIAFSASSMLQLALLWAFLRQKTDGLDERKIFTSLAALSVAGIGCAMAAQGMKYVVVQFIQLDTFWGVFLQSGVASVAGLSLYVLLAYLLKSPELKSILSGVQRKFLKNAQVAEVGDVSA
jgi:putative peptidoglycan lipid II flippase